MTYLKKRLNLFRNTAFTLFFISALCATFGDGLSYIIMTWLVLKAYGGVSSVAILMLCFWLPKVIFGPWCGVLADRYSRKKLVIISNALRCVLTVLVVVLLYRYSATYLYFILAFSMGICWALYTPAAMALVCELVSKKDLLYANATIDTAYELGNVAGMGIAGAALALFSPQVSLLFTGLVFLFAMLTAWQVVNPNPTQKAPVVQAHWLKDLQQGLHYLQQRPYLFTLSCIQLLIMVEYMTTPVLLAPFASQVLHANASEFGLIEVALSIGLILGGLLTPYLAEKWSSFWVLLSEMLLLAVWFWWFSINTQLWVAVVLYGLMGFCFSTWPLTLTEVQRLTDMPFQGRVQATFNSLSGISILAVYLLVYFVDNHISIQGFYWIEIFFAAICIALFFSQRVNWHIKSSR